MNGNVVYPPSRVRPAPSQRTVFLAGAIDNGAAVDWQAAVVERFKWRPGIMFFNPRRLDWNPACKQEAENEDFSTQVEWELDKINDADLVFMFFPNKSVAPITLMEFGMIVSKFPEKLVIVAELEYWRRGNLEVVCRREKIELFDNLDDGIEELLKRFDYE